MIRPRIPNGALRPAIVTGTIYFMAGLIFRLFAEDSEGLAPSQAAELCKYTILGLALWSLRDSRALRQMQNDPDLRDSLAPAADDLIDSALIKNQKIQRKGLADYFRDPRN